MSAELHTFKYNEFSERKRCDGLGQFGTVYVATHRYFPKVAVRVISRRRSHRPSEDSRLLEEARTLFGIISENVVRLLGVVMDEVLGLVYEYADFGPLDKLLIRHKMQWPLKIKIAHEIAQGMDFLHSKHIMHLRLKSRNILIAGNIQVKISDLFFYHSREMRTWSAIASQSTAADPQAGTRESTVAHIPPECSRNINLPPEKSWDVYAYGIILWEIMTDKTPYENKTEICRNVAAGLRPNTSLIPNDRPDEIYQLMEECWEADNNRRPYFEHISQRLKVIFKPVENEAREQALKCQNDIKEFFFNESKLRPPEGDMYKSSRNTHTSSRRPQNANQVGECIRETASPQKDMEAPLMSAGVSSNGGNIQNPSDFAISTRAIVESPESKNDAMPIWINVDDSSRQINANDLYAVAGCIETDYRDFGKNVLKLSENDIDIIEEQYDDDCLEIAYQMLRRWKEDAKIIPTVSYLVKVLKSTGYSRVVDHLRP